MLVGKFCFVGVVGGCVVVFRWWPHWCWGRVTEFKVWTLK